MMDFAYAPGYDAAQALENALSYRVGVEKAGWGHLTSSFLRETRRTLTFRSGAEGSRTPDLRRAKAALLARSELIEVSTYADPQFPRLVLRCRRVL